MSAIVTWWESLKRYVPWWLSNRPPAPGSPPNAPNRNAGFRILWSMILPLDAGEQAVQEGLRAQLPGLGTPTAAPYIAQSRGLIQGESETYLAFSQRAIGWLTGWTQDGFLAGEWLARNIQAYFANGPAVTIVDRSGQWTVLTSVASGSVCTETKAAWNWDGTSDPARAGYWSDIWIIIYPCEWAQAVSFENRKASPRGAGDGIGVTGGQAMRRASDAILQLVASMRDGHTNVRAIVFSYDATLCVPGGGNNPDGTWGHWSRSYQNGGTTTKVPARSANARYMIPWRY